MARKRSTCPWTCAWKKGLFPLPPPPLSTSFPFVIVPLCTDTRAGFDRKPIFGAGRSTSLTDEWRANIDSPRGNWGTRRACNTSLCATSADEKSMGRLWIRPPFCSSPSPPGTFAYINALVYPMLRDKRRDMQLLETMKRNISRYILLI